MPNEPPIPLDRLQVMIGALAGTEPLPPGMRAEIADALDCLFVTLTNERRASSRGRQESPMTWSDALFVLELVRRYNVKPREACRAVVPAANPQSIARLERAYRKLKAGSGPFDADTSAVNEDAISGFAARLPRGARRGRIIRFR